MKLADLQAKFQSALLDGGNSVLAHIPDSPRETKEVLFGVYRNAYVLRLLGILREDFERLHTYIGDDAFDAIARSFIAARPSQTLNARYYGAGFPDFVAHCDRFSDAPMVSAIARLEGALNDIFDCTDVTPLSLAGLADIAAEDFAALCFAPHPSVRRIDGPPGLEATFSALSNGNAPPTLRGTEPRDQILVWRKDVVPHYRALTGEEAMMWDEAAEGVPFGILCEMVATYDDPATAAARAAGYLQSWISSGLLLSATLKR